LVTVKIPVFLAVKIYICIQLNRYYLLNEIFTIILILLLNLLSLQAQSRDGFQIARLKYQGGGDWYNDPSAEVNLLNFIQQNTNIKVDARYQFVDLSSDEIFSYPFLFLTGHGNIVFSKDEVYRLRTYLENGGFLYIDDDYGLDTQSVVK